MRTWLATHGFPDLPITNQKDPSPRTFVDDRALRFAPSMVDTRQKQRHFLDLVLRYTPYWQQTGKSLRIRPKEQMRSRAKARTPALGTEFGFYTPSERVVGDSAEDYHGHNDIALRLGLVRAAASPRGSLRRSARRAS